MNINQPGIAPQVSTLRYLTIAVLVLLGCFANASAQWTTTGNDIYNSNSGNVGIGTSGAPSAGTLLEVKKSQSAGTLIAIDNPFTTSGNSAFSGLFFRQAGTNRLLVSSVNDNHGTITPGTAQFWNFANAPTVFATNNAERMRLTSGGNLGIGTTSPNERLVTLGNMLVGHITSHTQLYSSYDSQSNMIMEIGYGTATPDITPLASFVLSKNLTSTNQGLGVISFANSNIANGNEKRLASISAWTDGALNSGALAIGTTSTGTLNERIRIDSNGNVGIGTSTPGRKLEILASDGEALRVYRNASTAGWGVNMKFSFNNSSGTRFDYAGVHGLLANATAGAEAGDLLLSTAAGGSLTEKVRVTSAGSVGIGTPSPSYKLHVVGGSVNATDGLCINGDCKSAWSQVASQWASGSGSINYAGGSVGIGITSPLYTLDVNGGLNGFRAKAGTTSANDAIATFENSSAIKMIVRGNGNVGIGTTSPAKPLDVVGDINASGTITAGNIKANYQDLAEWVESSQELPAGTVVVLDRTKSNQVIASTHSYDSRVAGVISLQPGITLGREGEGRVLVATTGRVKVMVDATNGPIQIGDLLVTSDKSGVAMKSVPIEVGGVFIHRPGTLIGKALEPLEQGTGEILVLLSLQ
jgi:hypothetical protein